MKDSKITKDKIQTDLIDFLCKQFYVEEEDIKINESLVDTGIIDSMGLFEIASYTHKSYNFEVQEHQMNKENFGSVIKITNFLFAELEE